MILVTRCIEVWDESALEAGDTDERWIDAEDVPYTFKELLHELRNYTEVSQYPLNGDTRAWAISSDQDFRTGEETVTNEARSDKYWRKALLYTFGGKK
jgi:hypothetical protein